jgi:hypothetical protein
LENRVRNSSQEERQQRLVFGDDGLTDQIAEWINGMRATVDLERFSGLAQQSDFRGRPEVVTLVPVGRGPLWRVLL